MISLPLHLGLDPNYTSMLGVGDNVTFFVAAGRITARHQPKASGHDIMTASPMPRGFVRLLQSRDVAFRECDGPWFT